MTTNELFCKSWDAPYKHGEKYKGSYGFWRDGETLILSFQHTVQDQDWRQNFKFTTIETRNFGNVHKGFYQQFTEIYPAAETELQSYKGTYKRLIIEGWSQGAALAMMFYEASLVNATCIVYGAPNFLKGEKDKRKWARKDIIEIRNNCDIFTRLAPWQTKPETQLQSFDTFNLIDALTKIEEKHTSYIFYNGGDV